MKNKYYTPEINEFFLNFEYERNDGNGWYKKLFDGFDFSSVNILLNKSNVKKEVESFGSIESYCKSKDISLPINFDSTEKILKYLNYSDCIRVKILDKEDIESLEFEEVESGIYMKDKTKFVKYTLDTRSSRFAIRNSIYNECWFYGTIKNKSELIKILKQLNID